ncbi:cyanophycinase [Actinoplanes campanulatus]|uniref:Cyanophycinase n=1 Tax=Actinoplanes campanulatus TaxID=113559 RepID=A0A7W5FBQ0_9ACTN|nr:cyanophycinase [Actinoplanes campanulatus]MBB3092426.1 cyanophycinase [Actinoplanes campanulatus]GGN47551.1 cyanophycinase [Actinoplanes campanulatus]GID34480.1 cyanophycinase [Actinoplanes campanulatus]
MDAGADPHHGRLLIMGGAAGSELLGRFVELAGSGAARIVVIATASESPESTESAYRERFAGLGAGDVRALRLAHRAAANAPETESVLRAATGVFFTGGDQERITGVLGGTATDTLLHALVGEGRVVLAGTSAGAAVMSATMIIGGERPGVAADSVRTGPGLEFLPCVLIDQHFAERGRLNRLLSAVARYPHELGVGIDEDTAILTGGDTFEVLGSGAVTVVDAGAATDIRVPPAGPITLAGARIHVLPAGCTFHLSGRRPGTGPPPEREPAP